jgi:hypothetical protein
MKRTFGLIAIIAGLLLPTGWGSRAQIGVQTPTSAPPPNLVITEEDDPDIPPVAKGKIDKGTYLRMRAEHDAFMRGFEPGRPLDPFLRRRALLEMERQEARLGLNNKNASGAKSAQTLGVAASSTNWTWVGPAPIPNGQTEQLVTPVSGRTISIAVHPTNPNIAFVGTAQGGLYRTLDGGVNWTQLMDGADSLAIGAIAIAPSDPSIVYVGTGEPQLSADSFFGVGLYRINNALTTAELTGPIDPPVATGIAGTRAFTGRSVGRILVHPTDPATVFVSTVSGTSSNPSGGSLNTTVPPLALRGVYRSTNATAALADISFGKLTVTSAGSIAPDTTGDRDVIDMVLEPGVPNNLVCTVLGTNAANDGGVWRTTNALAANPSDVAFTRTLALGAATAADAQFASLGRAELAVNKVGPVTTVYVASGESSGTAPCATGGTLRRSVDGGVTWTPPLPGGNGFCAAQCFYNIALAVDPVNPNDVMLGGNVTGVPCSKLIAKSADGGATFEPTAVGVHADNHVVVFAPSDPTVVYMGTDGGVYKSTNSGVNFTSFSNTTFSATQFQSIALHPTDRNFLIGGTQDNGSPKMNPDGTWTRSDSGDGGYALIDQNSTDTTTTRMYHTYFNSTGTQIGWARSLNAGTSWSFFNCGGNGIPCSDPVLFYAPIALGPGNPNTLYFGTNKLYRSTNGQTMTAVSQALTTGSPTQPMTSIGISPQNDNVRIVGMRNGKVFATVTGGNTAAATLTDVTSPSFPQPNVGSTRRAVGRAVIDPNSHAGGPYTAYVTFGGYNVAAGQHVWKTTDLAGVIAGTASWVASGSGIPDVPVNAFVVDPSNSNLLYAGTDIGVYRSIDGGASWLPYNTGMPRIAVFDLAVQNNHRILRAATHGRGIWEIALPSCGNVALASAGATASASSTYTGRNYSPAGAIDGDRLGANWESGGGWNDATRDVWDPPDILEVSFNGSKTINQINVYTLQDNFKQPVEPTPGMTATLYGLLDFEVQYCSAGDCSDGSGWVTVPGGGVTGNTFVMRTFLLLPEITTTKIRVKVTNAREHFSRIVEVEAIGCDAP